MTKITRAERKDGAAGSYIEVTLQLSYRTLQEAVNLAGITLDKLKAEVGEKVLGVAQEFIS